MHGCCSPRWRSAAPLPTCRRSAWASSAFPSAGSWPFLPRHEPCRLVLSVRIRRRAAGCGLHRRAAGARITLAAFLTLSAPGCRLFCPPPFPRSCSAKPYAAWAWPWCSRPPWPCSSADSGRNPAAGCAAGFSAAAWGLGTAPMTASRPTRIYHGQDGPKRVK